MAVPKKPVNQHVY